MHIETISRKVMYLDNSGEVTKITVKEANNTKIDELKKRFDYVKSILKGDVPKNREKSPVI